MTCFSIFKENLTYKFKYNIDNNFERGGDGLLTMVWIKTLRELNELFLSQKVLSFEMVWALKGESVGRSWNESREMNERSEIWRK